MPASNDLLSAMDGQLDELLLSWQELRRQGREVSAGELCGSEPALAQELERRILVIRRMEGFLGVGATAEPSRSPGRTPSSSSWSAAEVAIPGYEVLGVLKQGGMGIVYKARQVKVDRLVAIKMILAGRHAGAAQLSRFRTEAEAVGRLRHPNVVQIHEAGECGGQPFFSMEYVEGGSLADRLATGPMPSREAARLLEILARTMQTAHEQGIIHRDLKPANILLAPGRELSSEKADAVGSRLEGCVPKIADFGLAKKLTGETPAAGDAITQTFAIMGTPSYLAPEQAAGQNRTIGPAADIHALGAILYEMVTGRPPFQGETTFDTLEQVRFRDPVPPSQLQPRCPRDLETICLKCLRKEPGQRYASAGELADDLALFLSGRPIHVRPVGSWERAIKWCKRRPAIAALLALLFVVIALGFGLVLWQWREAEFARRDAEAATLRALASQKEAEAEKHKADEERHNAEISMKLADAERALASEQRDRAEAIMNRCVKAVDEYADVSVNAKAAVRTSGEPASILWSLTQFFVITSVTFSSDETLPSADRRRFAEQYASRAVKLLESLHTGGQFKNPAYLGKLRDDKNLDPLRSRADFQQLMREVQAQP
jgi:serine/threonine protein kinase